MQITKLIFHTYPKCITHLPLLYPTKSLYKSWNAIKLIVYDFILSFLIFVSYCTKWHLISLAHRLIAGLTSHPGCHLSVLMSEPQGVIFLLAKCGCSFELYKSFRSTFFFFSWESCIHAYVCKCMHIYLFVIPQKWCVVCFLFVFFSSSVGGQQFSRSTLHY